MKGRVVFVLKLKPGSEETFLPANDNIRLRHEVARGLEAIWLIKCANHPITP